MSVDYNAAMVTLFSEVFEGQSPGVPTWIIEREDGLFKLLGDLPAEAASKVPAPGLNTIGAHAFHVHYLLQLTNAFIRGEQPEVDWASSWLRPVFSEPEWDAFRASLQAEYDGVLAFLMTRPEWPGQDWLMGAMALIPHVAYHVGSIRQLKHIVLH